MRRDLPLNRKIAVETGSLEYSRGGRNSWCSGEMKVALALYPVSMKQLMDIADTGNIMPPKTTWFEPKLRSGLVIHKLS